LIVARKKRCCCIARQQNFFERKIAPFIVKNRITRANQGYLLRHFRRKVFKFVLSCTQFCAIVCASFGDGMHAWHRSHHNASDRSAAMPEQAAWKDTFDMGEDNASPAGDHASPFPIAGTIGSINLDIAP
jgi:hypothetical protein